MPTPNNLAGQRFGKLLVQERGPRLYSASGKGYRNSWVCLCDCGRTETFPDNRIPNCDANRKRGDVANECSHCKYQRVCEVCSKKFESKQYKACCSDDCLLIKKRGLYLDEYYRRVALNPDLNKSKEAKRRARALADPDFRSVLDGYEKKSQEKKKKRLATDPAYRDHVNETARQRYSAQAKEAQAKKQARLAARLDAMTPEQYEAWVIRWREYSRLYALRTRSTPDGYERYMRNQREYKRQQALRKLMGAGEELIKRSQKNE